MKKNRILALALTGILAATAAAPMAVFAESEGGYSHEYRKQESY